MPADRSRILSAVPKVPSSEVQWYFTADYYSGPISGLAYFRGKIHGFSCFPEEVPDQHIYVLYEFTPDELEKELRDKARFEELVGTHFSFTSEGTPLPRVLRDEALWKTYYEGRNAERDPDPAERAVVAWFDLAVEV